VVTPPREIMVPKFIKLTDKNWGEVIINVDRIILFRQSKEGDYSDVELDGHLTLTVEQTSSQISDLIVTAIQH
jgi:hypothetical protein